MHDIIMMDRKMLSHRFSYMVIGHDEPTLRFEAEPGTELDGSVQAVDAEIGDRNNRLQSGSDQSCILDFDAVRAFAAKRGFRGHKALRESSDWAQHQRGKIPLQGSPLSMT